MRFKRTPGLDYHHIQPLPSPLPRHCPGDLNDRRVLAARRLPWWDPDRDRGGRVTISFWFGEWL